ncbi:MAG TPA: hypothetical protein VK483_12265 [Chitinophagaceae bacterium]|nr:hypothetical protein [Chitinophagaceae bacterium]
MKKIITCIALLIVANSIYSQQNPSPALTKKDYLQKSKNQKTAAWLFTGGGIVITGLGISDGNASAGKSDDSRKTVLIVTGLAAVAVGITLFIAATENKKRAESLSFKMENAPLIRQGSFVNHSYPALSFRLTL